MSQANRLVRRDIIRQTTDIKQLNKPEINENEDYDLMVAKIQSKVNHKFLVMRQNRKAEIHQALEKLDSIVSCSSKLNILEWLSKKDFKK